MAEFFIFSDVTSDELQGFDPNSASRQSHNTLPVELRPDSIFPPPDLAWASGAQVSDHYNTDVMSESHIADPTSLHALAMYTPVNPTSSQAIDVSAQNRSTHGPEILEPWADPVPQASLAVGEGADTFQIGTQVALSASAVDWPRPALTAEGGFGTLHAPLTGQRRPDAGATPPLLSPQVGSTTSSAWPGWPVQYGSSENTSTNSYKIHTHRVPGCPKATTYSIELEHGASPHCLVPSNVKYASLQRATGALREMEEANSKHDPAAEGTEYDALRSRGQVAPEWNMDWLSNPPGYPDSDETAGESCHAHTSSDMSYTNIQIPDKPLGLWSPALATEMDSQPSTAWSTADKQAEAPTRRRRGRPPQITSRRHKRPTTAKISLYFKSDDGKRCYDSASKAPAARQLAHRAAEGSAVIDSVDPSMCQGRATTDGGEGDDTLRTMSPVPAGKWSGATGLSLSRAAVETMQAPYDATCISLRSLPREGNSHPVTVTFLAEDGRPVQDSFKVSSSQHLSKLLHTRDFILSMCTGSRDPRDNDAYLRSLPRAYTGYCRTSEKPYYTYESAREAQDDFGKHLIKRAREKVRGAATWRPILLRWEEDLSQGGSGQAHEVLLSFDYLHRTKTRLDQIAQLWGRVNRRDRNQLGAPTKPPPLWSTKSEAGLGQ